MPAKVKVFQHQTLQRQRFEAEIRRVVLVDEEPLHWRQQLAVPAGFGNHNDGLGPGFGYPAARKDPPARGCLENTIPPSLIAVDVVAAARYSWAVHNIQIVLKVQ